MKGRLGGRRCGRPGNSAGGAMPERMSLLERAYACGKRPAFPASRHEPA